jgi:hypothetical protein
LIEHYTSQFYRFLPALAVWVSWFGGRLILSSPHPRERHDMKTILLTDRSTRLATVLLFGLIAGSWLSPHAAMSQPKETPKEAEDELSDQAADDVSSSEPAPIAGRPDAQPTATVTAAPPPPPPPAAPPPSPFTFTLKGFVSSMLFAQDGPWASGNGGNAIFLGPSNWGSDKWFLGGDVRQSRLTFSMRGPEILAGATPVAVIEVDLGNPGYQLTSSGGLSAGLATRDAMGAGVTVPVAYSPLTNEPRSDEALVPRLRVAYAELNWGAGQNILRVGQYHNLLLGMIAGSASHVGLPLGYGAGQLGYRSPGITYLHRFKPSADWNLDIGLQINRNSWRDELPTCGPTQVAPGAQCLPGGVSLGEASMLPQFEARVMASGGLATNPLPFYYPNKWMVYVVGHYDVKDLSGVGAGAQPAPLRDSMSTLLVQAGAKVQLGPVLVAANGYTGKNSGNVLGNILQMQNIDKPDVSAIGAWAQVGIGLTKNLSLWGFAGFDKPNKNQAIAAFVSPGVAGRLSNTQFAGQLAWTDGPVTIAVEVVTASTTIGSQTAPVAATMAPAGPVVETKYSGVQPSATLLYTF